MDDLEPFLEETNVSFLDSFTKSKLRPFFAFAFLEGEGQQGSKAAQNRTEQSRMSWWGKNLHLEVAADEELASHDGQLVCSNVIELSVGDEEIEADEDEKNEKMRLSLGWGRGS